MRLLLRFLGFLFAAGTIVFLVGVAGVAGADLAFLQGPAGLFAAAGLRAAGDDARPRDRRLAGRPNMPRSAGSICRSRRCRSSSSTPSSRPRTRISTSMAASISPASRAPRVLYAQNFGSNRRPQGASTITQQVAKNFLLTNEVSFTRKIKEALLALRIERTYSKDKILELYLNEIYLGLGAYGIAAASLIYFDKSVNELTIAEAAYLAALPKAPIDAASVPQPRARDRAPQLRDRSHGRERLRSSRPTPTRPRKDAARRHQPRPTGAHIFAGEYFAEEVRRDIFERYGEKKLYEGGLSVRTTLDPKLQVMARKALVDGLVKFDEAQRLSRRRSASSTFPATGASSSPTSRRCPTSRRGGSPWCWRPATSRRASACSPAANSAAPSARSAQIGIVPLDGVKWAKAAAGPTRGKAPTKVDAGARRRRRHLCRSAARQGRQHVEGQFRLRQIAGSLRRHGRDGSVDRPRAGDGRRLLVRPEPVQPRDAGASPARLVVQAVRLCGGARQRLHAVDRRDRRADRDRSGRRAQASGGRRTIRPASSTARQTLRFGIEQSRNVDDGAAGAGRRHAADRRICQALRRLRRPAALSVAMRSAPARPRCCAWSTAYSMFANGGRRIKPTLIDRIQDRYGHTIYQARRSASAAAATAEQLGEPARADAGRPPRAGARSDDRLPDHLDDGRRGAARHRHGAARKSASRSPARPAPPTTRRTPGSSASRPISWSASISATTSRARSAAARPAAIWRRRSSATS